MPAKAKKTKSSSSGTFRRFLKEAGLFLADILYNAVIIILLVILIRSFLISPFRVVGSSMADTLQSNEFILINKFSYLVGEPERGDAIVFRPPVTSKNSYKFEEALTTNEEGVGMLDFSKKTTAKNVIYCQKRFIQAFWFCREGLQEGDIVFYRPLREEEGTLSAWKDAEKKTVTTEEAKSGLLTFQASPNQSYQLRVYSSTGPDYFVKRIIGAPGDQIKIENGRVYLKRSEDSEFTEISEPYLNAENKNKTYLHPKVKTDTFTVPEGQYFVMGDNRDHSNDSRSWFSPITQEHTPFVSPENISGKVLVVLWPLPDIRFIPSSGFYEQSS